MYSYYDDNEYYGDYLNAIAIALRYITKEDDICNFLNDLHLAEEDLIRLAFSADCPMIVTSYFGNNITDEHLECLFEEFEDENIGYEDLTPETAKVVAEALQRSKKSDKSELIEQFLKKTVCWINYRDPFETGFGDFECGCVNEQKSLLSAEIVERLFHIYAREEGWYESCNVNQYVYDEYCLANDLGKYHNRFSKDFIESLPELGEEATQWLIDEGYIDEEDRDDYDISPRECADLYFQFGVVIPIEEFDRQMAEHRSISVREYMERRDGKSTEDIDEDEDEDKDL